MHPPETARAHRAGARLWPGAATAALPRQHPSRPDLRWAGRRKTAAGRFESLAFAPAAAGARERPPALPGRERASGLTGSLFHRQALGGAPARVAQWPGVAKAATDVLLYSRHARAPAVDTQGRDHQARDGRVRAPATMVWRKSASAAGAPESARDLASTAPALRPSAPQRAATPAAAAPAVQKEALRAATLDPAIADRLADDVIRRVERRARIERERRGF
jgi:hypothetical protein